MMTLGVSGEQTRAFCVMAKLVARQADAIAAILVPRMLIDISFRIQEEEELRFSFAETSQPARLAVGVCSGRVVLEDQDIPDETGCRAKRFF